MTRIHFVVPEGIDDPARPSGGNRYDRRVIHGLPSEGWVVREHGVGSMTLDAVLESIPDDEVVLLDGLIASPAPAVVVAHSERLRLVALVHMPLGDDRERAVLHAARAVITTSGWGRRRLLELYALPADRMHVATPGVDAADVAAGTAGGGALLCVAAVTPVKGHDLLLDALTRLEDLAWRCECVGSLDRDVAFAQALRRRAPDGVSFAGPRTGCELDRSYAAADLLVLASRTETFGMAATEALARGLPVVATAVGGLPEAVGHGADGTRPGLLVAPDDPARLAAALRDWLNDPTLRARLRRAARERRATLSGWPTTTSAIAAVVAEVAA